MSAATATTTAPPILELRGQHARGCTRCAELGHYAKTCPYPADVAAGKRGGNRARRTSRPPAYDGALFDRLAAVAAEDLTIKEQAARMGVSIGKLYDYRQRARRVGYHLPPPKPAESAEKAGAFARIEAELAGPACSRDGLHGPHICVQAVAFARSGDEAASLASPSRTPRRAT